MNEVGREREGGESWSDSKINKYTYLCIYLYLLREKGGGRGEGERERRGEDVTEGEIKK